LLAGKGRRGEANAAVGTTKNEKQRVVGGNDLTNNFGRRKKERGSEHFCDSKVLWVARRRLWGVASSANTETNKEHFSTEEKQLRAVAPMEDERKEKTMRSQLEQRKIKGSTLPPSRTGDQTKKQRSSKKKAGLRKKGVAEETGEATEQ